MDADRFDALTRSFSLTAVGSRRRVLGSLLALAVAGETVIRRPAITTATTCGVPVTPVPANTVTGSCQDLTSHRQTTGVTEADGRSHPTWTGATRVEIERVLPKYRIKVEREGDRFCAATRTQVSVTYRFKKGFPKIYRLDWSPPASSSQACRDQVVAWILQVEGHECQHVNDAKAIVAHANNGGGAAAPKVYKACAATRKEAVQAVRQKVAEAIKRAPTAAELEQRYEASVVAFHQTAGGGPSLDPDCRECCTGDECCPEGLLGGLCCPAGDPCGPTGTEFCCQAAQPFCCHGGCWQTGSLDCGPYCCPPNTTCCGPVQRCCAAGFECRTDCSSGGFNCQRIGSGPC